VNRCASNRSIARVRLALHSRARSDPGLSPQPGGGCSRIFPEVDNPVKPETGIAIEAVKIPRPPPGFGVGFGRGPFARGRA
jgi:hypothetical protein